MTYAYRPTLTLLASLSILALIPAAQAQLAGGLVENRGQWPDEVLYMARLPEQTVWVTREALVFDFFEVENPDRTADMVDPLARLERDEARNVRGHVVELRFDGGVVGAVRPGRALTTRLNYFLGDDPARHASNVPVVEEVTLEGLYDGVALRLRPEADGLTLTFEADDPARLAAVRLTTSGGETLVDEEGTVIVETSLGRRAVGQILGHAGAHWYAGSVGATGVQVDLSRTTGVGHAISSAHSAARSSGEGLVFSTFLGGTDDDGVDAVAVGSDGSATVSGNTKSSNFPTTPGAYDETYNGSNDVFVARLSADGASLLHSTFLGGTSLDIPQALAVGADGSATVAGRTGSSSFPTTSGAFDETFNGDEDAFVARLSADGASLLYSTFLGETSLDNAYAVALGADGSATVAGGTSSSGFPTTPAAYDETYNGAFDAFVARLSADGTSLVYSTFLGGGNFDSGWAVAVGADGSATVVGLTESSGFPTTSGAYDETYNGDGDAFVARLSADGTSLLYSTFLGGPDRDNALGVAVGAGGSATVDGSTDSAGFPTTPGTYDETYNGDGDAFVARLSADGTSLYYSTFFGGADTDAAFVPVVGADGSATVAGYTNSSGFPTTPGAYDETYNGSWDVFAARLSADGTSLVYSTFLGGTSFEYGYAVAVGADGSATVAGPTSSSGFPTTPGAYDETHNGGSDAFVARLELPGPSPAPDLVITALDPNPDQAPPGGSVSVAFSVLNTGQTASMPSQTNLRLGTSPTEVTVDDPLLAEIQVPAVNPGNFLEFQEDVTIPAALPPGQYYLWAIADVNSTAGQTPEGELNDKVNVPFVVTGGDDDVFVYQVEFTQGAQDVLSDAFATDPVDIIPGKDLIVRYYAFGTMGPVEDFAPELRLTTTVGGVPQDPIIVARNDGFESVDLPADPGTTGTLRDEQVLDQRINPGQSVNFVVVGDLLDEAESVVFELVDGDDAFSDVSFSALQENKTTLVLHVYRIENGEINRCADNPGLCESGAVKVDSIEARVMPYVERALPFGLFDTSYSVFHYDPEVWESQDYSNCTAVRMALGEHVMGEPVICQLPSNPFKWTRLAIGNIGGYCNGIASLGGTDAVSQLRGESAAHEIVHTVGFSHASNAHNEEGGGGFEEWDVGPHGLMGEGLNEFGLAPLPAPPAPITETNPDEYELVVVDPCPNADYEERSNVCDATDPERVAPHELMSYGQSDYDFSRLNSNLHIRRWLSPHNYTRVFERVRDEAATSEPIRLISSAGFASASRGASVPAYVVTGYAVDGGTGRISPLIHKDVTEETISGQPEGDYQVELYGTGGEVLESVSIAPLELMDVAPSDTTYFQLVVPFAESAERIAILDKGVEVAELEASPNAPTTVVISPNGGETYMGGDSLDVAWSANDADGDDLRFIVQYSPDSGTTWQTLGLVSASGEFIYPASALQSSTEALIRISVTDGLRTAEDVSDAVFIVEGTGTGIGENGGSDLPTSTSLGHVYPNPVGRTASVTVRLESSSSVILEVFDILGRKVSLVADAFYAPGQHTFEFDTSRLATGIYLVRGVFESGEAIEQVQSRRFTVLR